MRRERKYRAWNNETARMIPWEEIKSLNNLNKLLTLVFIEVLDYTGLKDMKGDDIYEGDIIHSTYTDGKPCRHIIQWNNETASFVGKYVDYQDEDGYTKLTQSGIKECQKAVIGNIYQNPELIKTEPADEVSDTTKDDQPYHVGIPISTGIAPASFDSKPSPETLDAVTRMAEKAATMYLSKIKKSERVPMSGFYTDGIDHSHLDVNNNKFPITCQCEGCHSIQTTITETPPMMRICHACGLVEEHKPIKGMA